MLVAVIKGHTRILGEQQGFLRLPIRDDLYEDGMPLMVTAWEPSPEEMIKIALGAKIEIAIMGTEHPPISVVVGEVPTMEKM